MAISSYDVFYVWQNESVSAGGTSPEVYCDKAEALAVYFNLSGSVDIALEAYIDGRWIEVYRWVDPGIDWVSDTFIYPMAEKVRLKALSDVTAIAYICVKK